MSAEPEVTWFQLKPRQDEFAILASDGLWDVLVNNEAVEIVKASNHTLELTSDSCTEKQPEILACFCRKEGYMAVRSAAV